MRNLSTKIFGYTPKIFLRRVLYYAYLKYTKLFCFRQGTLGATYDEYFMQEGFNDFVKESAEETYRKCVKTQVSTSDEEKLCFVSNILRNRFEIFGYCVLGDDIPWKLDPVSRYEWPEKAWYRDGRKRLPGGTDIKRPWELSRMHFLLPVSLEFFSSGDQRLADYVIRTIGEWSNKNPLASAPNWSCTMEVAIRCANIALAVVLISSSRSFARNSNLFIKVLNEHIGFILNNLENISKITSNHYVANISGLFVTLKILPLTEKGMKALNFAKSELELEIEKQTLSDGWNFELSSNYHRLVFEFFFYSYIFSSPGELSERFIEILRKQYSVLDALVKPNGKLVQIGDNDSGRFIVPTASANSDATEMGEILSLYKKALSFSSEPSSVFLFKHAEIYVIRSEDCYLIIKGGLKGQAGQGGHSHNDALSFELHCSGQDILVDPGTGTYTSNPSMRNRFRSSSAHNGVFWEGVEESSLDSGLFLLPQENDAATWATVKDGTFIFYGKNSVEGYHHVRTLSINLLDFQITIVDKVSSPGAFLNFSLPDESFEKITNGFRRGNCVVRWDGDSQLYWRTGCYSPGYGLAVDCSYLRVPVLNTMHTTRIVIEPTAAHEIKRSP